MARTHGHYGTPTYRSWQKMLGRCTDTSNNRYERYGGRGIMVHGPWLKFENFLADMGERPSRLHSIDRIDPNGNYEPSNCRWILNAHQSKTRATNHYVTHAGETMTLADWGRRIGIKGHSICRRLRNGWSVEDALTLPAAPGKLSGPPGNSRTVTYNGRTQTLAQWAREIGVDRVTLWQRIYKYNWPLSRAIGEPTRGWCPGRPRSSIG